MRYLILSLLAVGLVSVILTLLLVERLVLARLANLSTGVSTIGARGDLSMRLSLPGKDELADLADAINGMLQALQDSLAREKRLKQEVQELRIVIDEVKRQKQVSEIVETDFFQDLQAKAQLMRHRGRLSAQDVLGDEAPE